MFFHWCSYLNSCSNLMICSLKFKKEFLALKMMLLILCFEAFNLYPIQVVVSLPWWIKHTMRQLLIFFLWKCLSFFSYVGGALVFNFFSVILFDKHILAIQQTITHEEDLWHSFWSVTICWTAAEALVPWSKQQKMAKKSFLLGNFSLLWCMLCTTTPDLSRSSDNINSKACVSRLSFCFLWLYF